MKKLLFPVLIVALTGCNKTYPSEAQAREACSEWMNRNKQAVIAKMNEKPPIHDDSDIEREYEQDIASINRRSESTGSGQLSKKHLKEFAKDAYEASKSSSIWEFSKRQKAFDKKAAKIGYFYCSQEGSTRQFLGYKGKSGGEEQIVKHFRY